MRLQEYGRNPNRRKVSMQQPGLLLVGIDVSTAKHRACLGTQTTGRCQKLDFPHPREGFTRFEQTRREPLVNNSGGRLLMAMAPAGLSWQGLSARLRRCGDEVCLVRGHAVHNHRQTMPETISQTDEKAADSVFALLRPGTCFLPVARDAARPAAYRVLRRSMARKKRVGPLCHQLRTAIPLAFPEGNPLRTALPHPTARRFLLTNPTPESVRSNGRRRFLETWRPRRRCGQWRPETFQGLYALATSRLGLKDPSRSDACAIPALAPDRVEALGTQQRWLDNAIALRAPRADCQRLMPLPRIGQPPAAALRTAIGKMSA